MAKTKNGNQNLCFEDFYPGEVWCEAIADGEILKYSEEGYEDEKGNVFDTFGSFLFQRAKKQ